jgi:predicted DNA-binding ribbon-helix-helix protein
MWEALQDIARRQERTVHDLVTQIDRERTASSLTAAIRVYIVAFYRSAASLAGASPAPQPTRFRIQVAGAAIRLRLESSVIPAPVRR